MTYNTTTITVHPVSDLCSNGKPDACNSPSLLCSSSSSHSGVSIKGRHCQGNSIEVLLISLTVLLYCETTCPLYSIHISDVDDAQI